MSNFKTQEQQKNLKCGKTLHGKKLESKVQIVPSNHFKNEH